MSVLLRMQVSRVYVGKERAFAGIINTKAKLFVESLGIIKFEFIILDRFRSLV